jgi:prepilin-type N-terminal cleavage/methylation domain-containing protein
MRINNKGFTLLELLVAIGIIAIIVVAFYPSILNSLETRSLENEAREILMTMEQTKFRAVKSKLNHRVRFDNSTGQLRYIIEREDTPGTWNEIPGVIGKTMSSKFNITVNLPTLDVVVFSPLGFVTNYDTDNNNITIQSDKLKGYNQPDQRVVRVLAGGSIQYIKSESGT